MAYRFEKNSNGQSDIVIDGFEKGIASSPFKGIGNIRNLNIKYYDGVAYVNYKRQGATIQNSGAVSTGTITISNASPAVCTLNSHGLLDNDTITLTTTGSLPTGLSTGVTYYVVNKAANTFQLSLTRGGTAINTSSNGSGTHTFTVVIAQPQYATQSPAGIIYISDNNRTIFKQTSANGSTFKTLAGNADQDINGLQFWNNYLFTLGGATTAAKIEVCGDGTGDAGVTSSNWNTTANSSVTFTVTIPASPLTTVVVSKPTTLLLFTEVAYGLANATPVTVSLSAGGSLPSDISAGTVYYTDQATADSFYLNTDPELSTNTRVGGSLGSGDVDITTAAVFTANNHGLVGGQVIRLSTTGALPTGLATGTNYYVTNSNITTNTFMVTTSAVYALDELRALTTTGSQSGTHSYISQSGVFPIQAATLTLTETLEAGATSATLSSYTDVNGLSIGVWNGPTGVYNLSIAQVGSLTQVVTASLEQGSNAINFTPALNKPASGATATLFYNGTSASQTGVQHMSLVTANDGDLYFCNGANIGAIKLNFNQIFSKNNMSTFTFNSNVLALPPTETSAWMTELKNNLIVMGQYKLYPWDFTSPYWQNPVPMDEKIIKGINILNNIYLFAGNKGNIYISNGYSVSRYARLPDYVAGVVDPSWNIGGIMQHRQKLYFQALAKNGQTGSNLLAGAFSLDLDTGALNMENQFSAGTTPTGMVQTGVLIDDNDTTINYDKWYSAFGANVSYIDYNDTTLYSNNEPMIETDIIPVGTFLQNRNFSSAEFKLDQPMQSGDSISLYGRQSLSDAYTLLGTTTSAVLSDAFQTIPLQNWQWLQLKATFSCNATSTASSFNRLREIRIR